MPAIPAKFVDKEKVVIREKETFVMEVEAECDRQSLCSKIIQLVDSQVAQAALTTSASFNEPLLSPNESKAAESRAEKSFNKSSKK
jgi:hypothetical protein